MKRKLVFSYSFLAIALVLLVVGVFAWFSLTTNSVGGGASIVATSKGNLRIYPKVDASYFTNGETEFKEIGGSPALEVADYTNTVDFSSTDLTPISFYRALLINQEASNISGYGNPSDFYYKTGDTTFALTTGDSTGLHRYIEFGFYFTGASGVAGTKEVYLTGDSGATVTGGSGTGNIKSALRVAFLDYNGGLVGVWAPENTGDTLTFINSAAGDTGTISVTPAEGEKPLLKAGTEAAASTLLTIDTTAFVKAEQYLKVVMWIEGTDPAADDANLGQNVKLSMTFAMRDPE